MRRYFIPLAVLGWGRGGTASSFILVATYELLYPES